jgi:hypothetical protein
LIGIKKLAKSLAADEAKKKSGSGALHFNNELSREEEVVSHRRKSSPAIQRYPYMNYL